MQLCSYYRSIDAEFFSPAFDHVQFLEGLELHWPPVYCIQENAKAGCPFCTCLMPEADIRHMPLGVLDDAPVTIERAVVDPHQAVVIYNHSAKLV